jgi:hypothetical protein
MLLFSQRQKIARTVERRMKKAERVMDGIKLTRCHFNTINQLDAMGWLRDKPLRREKR